MNRKNTAATDRLIEAVHEHGMRTVIRLANVTLWWEEKCLEENVLRAFVYVISYTGDEGKLGSSFLWKGREGWGGQGICRKS